MMATQEEHDRLQECRRMQLRLFGKAAGAGATPNDSAERKPLRPDDQAAALGDTPGAGGRYPAKRHKRG